MIKIKNIIVTIILFLFVQSNSLAQEKPQWITESNKHTQLLLDIMAKFNPEAAARYGIEGIDEQIFDINPGFIERNNSAYKNAKTELQSRLENSKNANVKLDLQILIDAVDEQLENSRLEEKYFLPYFNLSEIIKF